MIRLASLALVAGCLDVDVERNVSYDDRFGPTRLDVYTTATSEPMRPAVMLVHGGSWREDSSRDAMSDPAERLARAGYVAINVEYRGTPGDGAFPGAVQDVLCALAFVRANASRWGIDPARVAGYGYSAGGHLVSMAAVAAARPSVQPDCAAGTTSGLAAVVVGAGPEELLLFDDADPLVDFLGGDKTSARATWIEASPITHVTSVSPPFLFVHGEDDWFVDIAHARNMKRALAAVGVESKLLAVPGAGHVIDRSPAGQSYDFVGPLDTPAAWAATIDFLDSTIGAR